MVSSISSTESKHAEPVAKNTTAHQEFSKHADGGLALLEDRVVVTEADSRRICRRTDIHVLILLAWVYFLQISDKSIIGLSAVFGLKKDAHLVGNQYSNIGNIGYYAQLAMQPLAAYLLVKVQVRQFVPLIVLLWGVSLVGMAVSTNYRALLATRFLLGAFEAAVLPAFAMITSAWYRRSEQPLRVATWTMVGSALVYGIGHIKSSSLFTYQIVFLIYALVTVITAPILYWRMDNSPMEARFLSPEDRQRAVERLRANQTGIASSEFKFSQVIELFTQPSAWIFLACSFCINVGASVSNVFGPLILQQLVGFTAYESMLLNIPFGAIQLLAILLSSWLAYRFKLKSVILAAFMVPVVIGVAILYAVPHIKAHRSALLVGYYLIGFVFAANPLLVTWISANTGGQTKKSAVFTAYNAASSIGNIAGPFIFKSKDGPDYYPGLKGTLAIFCVLIGLIGLQAANLAWLNRQKAAQRVANGQTAQINDTSMANKFEQVDHGLENAFLDMTDKQNPDFVYVL
ncbi:BQ5605_C004g03088 [Microbotryum silenes-dioicae]|uniref:BQ5605_C004g03088 protein n=1 Tax=Microbotryum silenes-dioicae TaxID=796604 RepID=A0A2X0ME94_9BASI|nr:BQ5605_C004g03088 [Microbotryum silenes-dioicae]